MKIKAKFNLKATLKSLSRLFTSLLVGMLLIYGLGIWHMGAICKDRVFRMGRSFFIQEPVNLNEPGVYQGPLSFKDHYQGQCLGFIMPDRFNDIEILANLKFSFEVFEYDGSSIAKISSSIDENIQMLHIKELIRDTKWIRQYDDTNTFCIGKINLFAACDYGYDYKFTIHEPIDKKIHGPVKLVFFHDINNSDYHKFDLLMFKSYGLLAIAAIIMVILFITRNKKPKPTKQEN